MHNNDPNAEPTEFKGRRILVTGGTRGIGEAIVDRLIRGGGDVIATARSVSPETSADRFVQADVSTRGEIDKNLREGRARLVEKGAAVVCQTEFSVWAAGER